MEAQKRPKAKPRTRVPDVDLGPAPVPPSHRSIVTPLTEREIRRAMTNAPDLVTEEPGAPNENGTQPEQAVVEEQKDETEKIPETTSPTIKLPSPQVTEMPISALLPREESAPPLPPRMYPDAPVQEKQPLPVIIEPPKYSEIEAPRYTEPEVKVKYPDLVEKAATPAVANLYSEKRATPAIATSSQYYSEGELLTEGQLLQYYQNEQLEFVDDFIDVFVEQELNPNNALFELLGRYKEVCEKLQMTSDSKDATVSELTKVNNEVWHVEDKQVTENGRCGDDRAATGSASYKEAKFIAAKIVELKSKLDELSQRELDEALCLEIRARSLALQIQWTVVMINNDFLLELRTGASALPTRTLFCFTTFAKYAPLMFQ